MTGDTVLSLLATRTKQGGGTPAVFHRVGGVWKPISLAALLTTSERIAASFSRLGLKPGDRLAIMCRTRVEWLLAELAAMMAGAIVVGIDAHAPGAQAAQILRDSEASALLVDTGAALAKIPSDLGERLSLIVAVERTGAGEAAAVHDLVFWDDLVGELVGVDGAEVDGNFGDARGGRIDLRREAGACTGQSAATLLYTSGTTGSPKGILYRQEQLAVACRAILDEFPTISDTGGKTICWLPMAALFQRMMNYVALAGGISIYFVEDPRDVVNVAKEVQPTYFVGVPRFFEKMYQGIQQELSTKPRWVRTLVEALLARGTTAAGTRSRRRRIGLRHAFRSLVLRRLRGVLGHRLRFMITGSAPTPIWMLEYFHRMGILLLEAYGLSENTVPMAANRPDAFRFGSVGRVFAVNDVRVADDGEILVRGPGLFDGYRGAEAGIDERFTEDGFYRTGDLGRIDGDGYLFITGRKSEIFKTSTGRWVAPAQVEATYKKIPYVEQIVVIGRGQRFPVALVSINEQLLASALRRRGRPMPAGPDCRDSASTQVFQSRMAADFEAAGTELASHEQVHHFALLPSPLTFEGGELTPSLKLRRDVIERKYRALIDELYTEKV
jgi:long-chain acyl-CoA synthetase